MTSHRYATRLNSFASNAHAYWPDLAGKPSPMQMAERAATAKGLTDLDLNYPDHAGDDIKAQTRRLADLGLGVNGLAMRYYTCLLYTSPSPRDRQKSRMPSSA